MYCGCRQDTDVIQGQGQGHGATEVRKIAENYTFLGLSRPPFWRAAKNWWLITIAWDLVYSYSQPDFLISPPVGGCVTSKFVKCWYHQSLLRFISVLPEARSLWLWVQVGCNEPCTLAAMTVSPPPGLFFTDWMPFVTPNQWCHMSSDI